MPDHPTLSALDFATRWKASTRTERAAAQEHFIDLCRVVGVLAPNGYECACDERLGPSCAA